MIAAVLPIKRFGMAKQRLERDDREGLMREMAARMLGALDGADLAAVYVVTSDPAAATLALEHGACVVEEPGLLGHSAAASRGVARAIEHGATTVLLLAGDCPLVRSEDIDALVHDHRGSDQLVVVLTDRHGTGTNGLLLRPPGVIDPAFGPGSRERHEERARMAHVNCVVEERAAFAMDVDTVEDLAAIDRHQRA